MEAAITPKTKAIVCTNGSNLTGNYVDVAAVGEMAHRHGVLLIVDASQTAGVFPIDVQKMNIDVLWFYWTQRSACSAGDRRSVCQRRAYSATIVERWKRSSDLQ